MSKQITDIEEERCVLCQFPKLHADRTDISALKEYMYFPKNVKCY